MCTESAPSLYATSRRALSWRRAHFCLPTIYLSAFDNGNGGIGFGSGGVSDPTDPASPALRPIHLPSPQVTPQYQRMTCGAFTCSSARIRCRASVSLAHAPLRLLWRPRRAISFSAPRQTSSTRRTSENPPQPQGRVHPRSPSQQLGALMAIGLAALGFKRRKALWAASPTA